MSGSLVCRKLFSLRGGNDWSSWLLGFMTWVLSCQGLFLGFYTSAFLTLVARAIFFASSSFECQNVFRVLFSGK